MNVESTHRHPELSKRAHCVCILRSDTESFLTQMSGVCKPYKSRTSRTRSFCFKDCNEELFDSIAPQYLPAGQQIRIIQQKDPSYFSEIA